MAILSSGKELAKIKSEMCIMSIGQFNSSGCGTDQRKWQKPAKPLLAILQPGLANNKNVL